MKRSAVEQTTTALSVLPLLPTLVVGAAAVAVMVAIALRRNYRLVAAISTTGLGLAFLCAVLQIGQVLPTKAASALFYVDGFAQVNAALILFCALAIAALSYRYFEGKREQEELYLLMLLSTTGATAMASAAHFASFFVALELLSVPMYGMLAYDFWRKRSLEAGLKYLVLSAAASATLLMGMALIFAGVGSLSFAAVGRGLLSGVAIGPLSIAGATLVAVAVAFKLSLAPFHAYAADVYQGAPTPVAAFLASVAKVAALAAAMRFFVGTATPSLIPVDGVLVAIVALSVFVGNFLALRQTNLKRLLAYSSIAHMGYALIALVSVGEVADTLSVMYAIVYALTTVAAFATILALSDGEDLASYRGLFWRRPILTAANTVAFLSLAGIPLTAGFMAKAQIMLVAVQGGRFALAALLIVGSAVGLCYYLNVVLTMYKRPSGEDVVVEQKANLAVAVAAILAVILVFWGILPNGLYTLASLARLH